MNKQITKRFNKQALVAALATVAAGASQAAFTVPTEVADAGASAALLGTAVLGVLIGIRAFKWIRKAM